MVSEMILRPAIPLVAIINESSIISDAQLAPIVAALQIQVWRDFAPAWASRGIVGAHLVFVPKGAPVPAGAWPLGICDHAEMAGALGYHEKKDVPIGWVGAQDDIDNGSSLSVTISHELLEMLGDPYIDQTFKILAADGSQYEYCVEACDAVEDDSLAYPINGILVSDFQLPAWWSDPAKVLLGSRYDFCGKCLVPLRLLAGGYIGQRSIDANGVVSDWTQLTARKLGDEAALEKPAHKIKPGSRRHRRGIAV